MENVVSTTDRASESAILGEWTSARLPELAGAAVVLTEFLLGAKIGENGNPVSAGQYPMQMLDSRIRLTDAGILNSKNEYIKSYPEFSGRLPVQTTDNTPLAVLSALNNVQEVVPSPLIQVKVNVLGSYLLSDTFKDLSAFWGDLSNPDAVRLAEKALSVFRFGGTKGARQILGWESAADERSHIYREMADLDREGQNYLRFMFYAWAQYLQASLFRSAARPGSLAPGLTPILEAPITPQTNLDYDPLLPFSRNQVHFTHLAALRTPGPQNLPGNINPEEPLMGNTAAASQLRSDVAAGLAHILDVSMMSTKMIRQAILHFSPTDRTARWAANLGTLTNPILRYSPLSRFVELNRDGTSISGVTHFIIHHGNRRQLTADEEKAWENEVLGRASYATPPDPVTGAGPITPRPPVPANSPWAIFFDRSDTRELIRHFCILHHASTDAYKALDMAIYRLGSFNLAASPAAMGNASTNHVDCFGQRMLRFPPDITTTAYFDPFRRPAILASDAPDIEAFFSLTPNRTVWHTFFSVHAVATSLNWAAYAYTMLGAEWQAVAAARVPSETRRNLVHQMVNRFSDLELNPWSVFHHTATALMYGFAPQSSTWESTSQVVVPQWHSHSAPWLANPYHEMWLLKMLPRHMVLPTETSLPTWPREEPSPMTTGFDKIVPEVRIGRDSKPFSGRAFLQDGGMMANLQHYAAVGLQLTTGALPSYREELTDKSPFEYLRLARWISPFQYDFPRNPDVYLPRWMASGGVFSNFLLPGSVRNYDSAANRVLAVGITHTQDPAIEEIPEEAEPAEVTPVTLRLFSMPIGATTGNPSTDVISPTLFEYLATWLANNPPTRRVSRVIPAEVYRPDPDLQYFLMIDDVPNATPLDTRAFAFPTGFNLLARSTFFKYPAPDADSLPPMYSYTPRTIVTPRVPPSEPSSPDFRTPWAKVSLAEKRNALAIRYIAPTAIHVEYPPVNDFSLLLWGNPISGAYEGMSFTTRSAEPESLQAPPPDLGAYQPSGPSPFATMPKHLANHNNPHFASRAQPTQYTSPGPVMQNIAQKRSDAQRSALRASAVSEYKAANPAPLPTDPVSRHERNESPIASYVSKNPTSVETTSKPSFFADSRVDRSSKANPMPRVSLPPPAPSFETVNVLTPQSPGRHRPSASERTANPSPPRGAAPIATPYSEWTRDFRQAFNSLQAVRERQPQPTNPQEPPSDSFLGLPSTTTATHGRIYQKPTVEDFPPLPTQPSGTTTSSQSLAPIIQEANDASARDVQMSHVSLPPAPPLTGDGEGRHSLQDDNSVIAQQALNISGE
jgi:hypothetical protein